MTEPNLFMRIIWKTNPHKAYFWYAKEDAESFEELAVEFGDEFNIKIGEGNYCIGSDYDKGEWLTCVANQKRFGSLGEITTQQIESKYLQCRFCQQSEYFTCRMMCRGDVCTPSSEKARKLCEPANTAVYLTYVGGEYKVGVSLGIPRRWIEQASDVATVVATAPGLEARRIEHEASSKLDLKLQVNNSTKIKNMTNINYEKVKNEIRDKVKKMEPIIDEVLQGIEGERIEKPDIQILNETYGDLSFPNSVVLIEAEDGIEFGGTIVALKGSILVVRQDETYYCMDMKKLRGRKFEFLNQTANIRYSSPQIIDPSVDDSSQQSIDDWF